MEASVDSLSDGVEGSTKAGTVEPRSVGLQRPECSEGQRPANDVTARGFGRQKNTPNHGKKRDDKAQAKERTSLRKSTGGEAAEARPEDSLAANQRPGPAENELEQQREREARRPAAFLSAWMHSNVPPEQPSLDWLSLRFHDVIPMSPSESQVAAGNLDFVQQYARYDLFVLNELTTFTHRLPEFREQDAMLGGTQGGFFEDTPENAVALFAHIFRGTGFSLRSLIGVPSELKAGVIEQYYAKARTADDYCVEVWNTHERALKQVGAYRELKAARHAQKLAQLALKRQGHDVEVDALEAVSYAQLMQGFAYVPTRKNSQQDFFAECRRLLAKHPATLRLPKVIRSDNYEELTERLRSALQDTVQLPRGSPVDYRLKEALRELARNAKETARRCIKVQACRVLRRVLASHISGFYPACFHALEGLPVTLTVFEEVKVSFKLHFGAQYHSRRTLYANDFRLAISTISWLQHQMRALGELAGLQTERQALDQEQRECLERIRRQSARGRSGFEAALGRLRRLLDRGNKN